MNDKITLNEILKKSANVNQSEWYLVQGNYLDYFYNDLKNLDEKVEFLKDIDFELIDDEYRRAFVNSTVRYLINRYIGGYRRSEFKPYYTDKYKMPEPTYPEYAKGNLMLILFLESPVEFMYNNIFVSENVLKRA
ncbi:hypothetical protein [uncultured Ezakiella sp.]|uniref:hypothetical protein n=1 Tax=uncultured Ezakiella sp. TaxID=1637529 RepID=UPI0025CC3D3E|nr:hypothetical protein [uncultured Ezakiella sp.]